MVGEADLLAGREEDEDLLLLVRLQETEEHVKFIIDVHDHTVVEKSSWCDGLQLLVSFVIVGFTGGTILYRVEIVDLNELWLVQV